MSFYNGKKILSVVKAWFKGGSLTLSAHGRYIPQDYGLEGFTDVINEAPETPTDVLKYIEGDNSVQYLAFGDDVLKIAGCFQCFPNLKKIYIQNTTGVLDIVTNAWDGTKVVAEGEIIVPNTLKSAYEIAYPNWNFSSWEYQTEFTIPYIEGISPTTLTVDYILKVVEMTGGDISSVNKVIVPINFVAYESGSIAKIQELFTSLRWLETTYEAGAMELDLQGDIVTEIVSMNKTLDQALVYARSIPANKNNFASDANLIILPPYRLTNTVNIGYIFSYATSFVYSSNFVITGSGNLLNSNIFGSNTHIIECNMDLPNITDMATSIVLPSHGKRYVINFGNGFNCDNKNITTNSQNLEKLILTNFAGGDIVLNNTTNMNEQAFIDLFNSLGTPTTTKTLFIGSTNLSKLTAEDIAIVTNKNWTLA